LITDWKKRGALRSLLFFVPLALRLEIRDFERNVLMKKGKSITSLKAVILVLFLTGFLFSILACDDKPSFKTEYQAIFTTSGHLMFGKIF